MPEHQYALLIGNGLSVAYNSDLAVQALTSVLNAEFQRASGGDVGDALSRFAAGSSGSDRLNFEDLLGPLDHVGTALVDLKALAPIARHAASIDDAIARTSDFLRALHRRGLATTLMAIDQRARGQDSSFDAVTYPVCEGILRLSENTPKDDDDRPSPVTVGTLNYDGLLHAGFIQLGGGAWGGYDSVFCDLAAGYGRTTSRPYAGRELECLPIRSGQDLLRRKIHLINLHGFLGWLWNPQTGERWKFNLDDLRGDPVAGVPSYWETLGTDQAEMLPVVVLTDRKGPAVAAAPFVLAYGIFERRLFFADRWFIGGCSLDDAPLLAAIKRSAQGRVKADKQFKLLFAGAPGRTDYDATRANLARELGVNEEWIVVNFEGFPDVVNSVDWTQWADT